MVRFLLCIASICGALVYWASNSNAEETVLPHGAAPPAIASGHFPDRVHELIRRNWNAVEASKMAKILGALAENVEAMAKSMGLPPAAAIPPEMKALGEISLSNRRNRHFSPYDQLLDLLEMAPSASAALTSGGKSPFSIPKTGNFEAQVPNPLRHGLVVLLRGRRAPGGRRLTAWLR